MNNHVHCDSSQYPGWLEANKGKISGSDLAMYEKQFECFQRLAAELDKPGDDMGPVMALMQEVRRDCFSRFLNFDTSSNHYCSWRLFENCVVTLSRLPIFSTQPFD
jgi:hypothetical protein